MSQMKLAICINLVLWQQTLAMETNLNQSCQVISWV